MWREETLVDGDEGGEQGRRTRSARVSLLMGGVSSSSVKSFTRREMAPVSRIVISRSMTDRRVRGSFRRRERGTRRRTGSS